MVGQLGAMEWSKELGQRRGRDAPAPDPEGVEAAMHLAATLWAGILGPPRSSNESGFGRENVLAPESRVEK